MANWESLIGAKIEAHRDTHKVCKIEDAGKPAPQQETKTEPEQPASGDAPTPESSTPEDNDMFGD